MTYDKRNPRFPLQIYRPIDARVPPISRLALTYRRFASQTSLMAQTYLLFDLGSDEKKVQQARHKLESWKQAFRLDKKLQYKLVREQSPAARDGAEQREPAKSEKASPTKAKSKSKSKTIAGDAEQENGSSGPVKLLVRLYFSGHEKLSEQRWLDRIPTEEPFKSASPKIVRETEPDFADVLKQFDALE